MAASYPTAVKSFTTKTDGAGQTIFASHVNDIQDEVAAIESDLINGIAHLRLGGTTLTIASDTITAVKSLHAVDTESAAATDNLATITAGTGVNTGHLLLLYAANVARVVTVKDATGNVQLEGGDYSLNSAKKTILLRYDGTNWVEVARAGATAIVDNAICDGRLTLTTVTPITTGDVTAATSVFFTPYKGKYIALYDGSANWNLRSFSELTLAVPATTSTMYDVFIYDNVGVAAIEALAWTNDTTRATALVKQDGTLVKTGATTRRYVGSFRTTGSSGQTEDSAAKRYVWNYYHRVHKPVKAVDTTNSWTYSTNTWRQANAAAANQVDVVVGVAEVLLRFRVVANTSNTNSGVLHGAAIGEDSTSTPMTGSISSSAGVGTSVSANTSLLVANIEVMTAVGRHFYVWLENCIGGSGTGTFYGDNGGTDMANGIYGTWEG